MSTPAVAHTKEPHYRLYDGENLVNIDTTEDITQRTKQKGRWKALKTLQEEAVEEVATGEKAAKRKARDSMSDDE